MKRAAKLNKGLRLVVPSLASLTYYRAFKAVSRAFDIVPWLLFEEIRDIPPNYLRIRVGVGNRVFANHIHYLTAATHFWYYLLERGIVGTRSNVLDIGVGCGRYAHHIRDLWFKGERFAGQYYGVDVDDELLGWCRDNFDRSALPLSNRVMPVVRT